MTTIAEVRAGTSVGMCAVVVASRPTRQTRNGDYMTWMALLDESAADLISGQLSVNVFRATDEEDMARLRLGDIIVMAGLKINRFNDKLQGVAYKPCNVLILPKNDGPEANAARLAANGIAWMAERIQALRDWFDRDPAALACFPWNNETGVEYEVAPASFGDYFPTQDSSGAGSQSMSPVKGVTNAVPVSRPVSTPIIGAGMHEVTVKGAAARPARPVAASAPAASLHRSSSRPLLTAADLTGPGKFFDFVGEVLRVQTTGSPATVVLSDYTRNGGCVPPSEDGGIESSTTVLHPHLSTTKYYASLNRRLAVNRELVVSLWDEHAQMVHTLEPGMVVLVENLKSKMGSQGMDGNLNGNGTRTGMNCARITVLEPDHPMVQVLQKRREKVETEDSALDSQDATTSAGPQTATDIETETSKHASTTDTTRSTTRKFSDTDFELDDTCCTVEEILACKVVPNKYYCQVVVDRLFAPKTMSEIAKFLCLDCKVVYAPPSKPHPSSSSPPKSVRPGAQVPPCTECGQRKDVVAFPMAAVSVRDRTHGMEVLVGGREEVLQAPLARVLTVMGTDTVVKLKLMSYRVRVSSGNDGATAVRYRVMDVEG